MAHCDDALREIYRALQVYQRTHAGANPPDLRTLIDTQGLSPWLLVCPAGGGDFTGSSYVYRGADLTADVPGNMMGTLIIAYDRQPWHRHRRNILFADGQVRRPRTADFTEAIRRDNECRIELGLPTLDS